MPPAYIAPPAEWAGLQETFNGWTEHLGDEEREETVPDGIDHGLVIGETPHSGNDIQRATDDDQWRVRGTSLRV